ncbi:MAG: septal ring lytic transglycosylase RlpA family protein [Rhizobacter sp.]|nr:septal ring lytic transglycosylase RlpA family protein [Rhizobacter sp.]
MKLTHRAAVLAAFAAASVALPSLASSDDATSPRASADARRQRRQPALDRSGQKRIGVASVYAHRLDRRKMADGAHLSTGADNAASKTLPLGTEARVTNLKTGQSTTVTIQDRGPYAKDRIVDLSPASAEKIGITRKEGVAPVAVQPITLPPTQHDTGH